MIEKRNLTCITCPIGCKLEIILEKGKLREISGNKCKRGKDYAKSECLNPVRTLTTTVKVNNKDELNMLPVKSEKPLQKGILNKCMEVINNLCIQGPINIGDIVIKNVLSTGINIIATKNIN